MNQCQLLIRILNKNNENLGEKLIPGNKVNKKFLELATFN